MHAKPMMGLMIAAISSVAFAETPAPSVAPAAAVPPPTEKMICKSQQEIGSLIRKKKRCLTKSQWRYVDEQGQNEARKMEEDNRSRTSGQ